ncbi:MULTISPECIES: hypothetical protein [unclassified Halorhabdus]|uniref:hypothetical protein n=1 Tax=unclassified Halorhabdus TaxID=2621901 RepID=UPI0012B35DF5|nr:MULTISPECIES: hypothetical protein [unclassified Halorhabdus]
MSMNTLWSFLLTMDLILMTMLALVFPVIEPGTAVHAIAIVTGILQLIILAGIVLILRVDWVPFSGSEA